MRQRLRNALAPTQLGDHALDAQPVEHDPDLLFGRELSPGGTPDILNQPLAEGRLGASGLWSHLRSFVSVMKPQSSSIDYPQSVSLVLTPDICIPLRIPGTFLALDPAKGHRWTLALFIIGRPSRNWLFSCPRRGGDKRPEPVSSSQATRSGPCFRMGLLNLPIRCTFSSSAVSCWRRPVIQQGVKPYMFLSEPHLSPRP